MLCNQGANVMSKSAVKTNDIYAVNGVYVNASIARIKANNKRADLELRANSLLFEVEAGLVDFHNEFKKDVVDDLNRLKEKWVVYNAMLG